MKPGNPQAEIITFRNQILSSLAALPTFAPSSALVACLDLAAFVAKGLGIPWHEFHKTTEKIFRATESPPAVSAAIREHEKNVADAALAALEATKDKKNAPS